MSARFNMHNDIFTHLDRLTQILFHFFHTQTHTLSIVFCVNFAITASSDEETVIPTHVYDIELIAIRCARVRTPPKAIQLVEAHFGRSTHRVLVVEKMWDSKCTVENIYIEDFQVKSPPPSPLKVVKKFKFITDRIYYCCNNNKKTKKEMIDSDEMLTNYMYM